MKKRSKSWQAGVRTREKQNEDSQIRSVIKRWHIGRKSSGPKMRNLLQMRSLQKMRKSRRTEPTTQRLRRNLQFPHNSFPSKEITPCRLQRPGFLPPRHHRLKCFPGSPAGRDRLLRRRRLQSLLHWFPLLCSPCSQHIHLQCLNTTTHGPTLTINGCGLTLAGATLGKGPNPCIKATLQAGKVIPSPGGILGTPTEKAAHLTRTSA